tara:strand:- start:17008 stop:17430 length:423 start_codon:yes stop_codon:yes gene_type:complete
MSDMAELMARLSSIKESESGGGSGGGGHAEGFHPGTSGSGEVLGALSLCSPTGQSFAMSDKIKGLEDILTPSTSINDILEIPPDAGQIPFSAFDKFALAQIQGQVAAMPQKNIAVGALQPPHLAVGGHKTIVGKRGEEKQ